MKANTHPEYGPATIRCACGNVIETQSTLRGTVQVEICSQCHPFFTGKSRVLDTAGVIDRFKKKYGDKVVGTQVKAKKAPEPVAPKKAKKEETTSSLKAAASKAEKTSETPAK